MMWVKGFRYIVSFDGDVILLDVCSSISHDVAHVHLFMVTVHENIMGFDVTSMGVWKN